MKISSAPSPLAYDSQLAAVANLEFQHCIQLKRLYFYMIFFWVSDIVNVLASYRLGSHYHLARIEKFTVTSFFFSGVVCLCV